MSVRVETETRTLTERPLDLPLTKTVPKTRTLGFTLLTVGMLLISFNTIRFGGGYPLADLFFVAALAITWFNLIAGKTRRLSPRSRRRSPILVLVGSVLLLTGSVLSGFWSFDVNGSTADTIRIAWITVVWFWLLRTLIVEDAALLQVIGAFKISMLIATSVALTNHFGITSFGENRLPGRENAFATHPITLGSSLAVALPFFVMNVGRLRRRKGPPNRIVSFGIIGLMFAAIGTTASLTALVGATMSLVVVGFLLVLVKHPKRRRSQTPFVPLLVLGVSCLGIILLINSSLPVVEKARVVLAGEDSSATQSVASRPAQNQYVIDQIDRLLLIGVGHDLESKADSWDHTIMGEGAHNIFVKILYEAGLIAVIGFIIIQVAVARQLWILTLKFRSTERYPLLVALWGSFAAAMVTAQFGPVITERWYWLPTALITVAWSTSSSFRLDQAEQVGGDVSSGHLASPPFRVGAASGTGHG